VLIARYLKTVAGKTELTERGLYPVLAKHVLEGLLGYPEPSYRIEPKRQLGVPDLELLTDDGTAWVVGEVKLDDAEVLDPARRARLLEQQARAYLRPETVHVLLCSPRAFCVLDVAGELEAGVHLADEEAVDLRAGRRHDLSDESFRLLLGPVSYEEACSRRKYERFRRGEAPSGYLPLTEDMLGHFEAAFQYASETLLQHARRAWDTLEADYAEACRRLAEVEDDRGKLAGDDDRGHEVLNSRRWHVRKQHAVSLGIHEEDYPQFRYGQAYAGTQGADNLRDIFLTDTVYVVLSRLLFVRLCEDLGLVRRKVSNRGLAVWRELVTHLQDNYQDLLEVAFKDARFVYSRLFEATVFDWYTGTDGELSGLLERILYRLNAFSFRDLDRDLLGKIYQRFLPAEKRKRLGEFYTDDEVVDYLLWRTGFMEDPEIGARLLLDPACGSNTFGVRAAAQLLARFTDSPPAHQIDRIREALIGCDINPFAVFIAQMSLLFTVLSLYRQAKEADPTFRLPPFEVRHGNSLLEYRQADLAGLHRDVPNGDPGAETCDYVVGNPPYVRNERVPPQDREMLAGSYSVLRHRNTDLSAYFIYRAVTHWLRPGGRLGFVVSLGLANSEATQRLRQHLRKWRIEEVVSLEWMATELFAGADIVPMLLVAARTPAAPDDPVSVVTGLREKADLARCMADPAFKAQHTSILRRAEWDDLSPFGDWCLEATAADVPLLQALRAIPTVADRKWGSANYGIKLGARAAATDLVTAWAAKAPKREARVPYLKGSDLAAFGVSPPQYSIDISRASEASDPAIWGSRASAGRPALPVEVAILPGVYVTLSAAVIDPSAVAANNSTVLALPLRASAHALCALINSLPVRYYHFLAMRSAILLRRRSTLYPRTIENLPCPDLDAEGLRRLDGLSREAHRLCAEADVDEVRLVLGAAEAWQYTRTASVLLDFGPWPTDERLSVAEAREARVEGDRLILGRAAVRGEAAGLRLLGWLVQAADRELAREDVAGVALPRPPEERQRVVAEIEARVAAKEALIAQLGEVEEQIDDLVMDGLGLSVQQKAALRARCREFPLSETVMRPRYLWSEDRKRQRLRRYEGGARYR